MKKLFLLPALILLIVVTNFTVVSGLLIAAPCEEDTVKCKIEQCQASNALEAWNNGAYNGRQPDLKDCTRYEKELNAEEQEKYLFAGAGAVGATGALAFLFLLRKLTKKHSFNKKK